MKKLMQSMLVLAAVTVWAHAAGAAASSASSGLTEADAYVTSSAQAKIQVNLALKGWAEAGSRNAMRFDRDNSTGYATVTIQVFNYGYQDLVSPAYLTLYLDPETQPTCGRAGVARRPLGIIRARSSRFYTFTSVYMPDDSITLCAFVDSSCVINESSERDNIRAWSYWLP